MAKEDRSKALGNGNKKENKVMDDISQTVAEGSTVVLDAHDFIKDMDIDTIKSYS